MPLFPTKPVMPILKEGTWSSTHPLSSNLTQCSLTKTRTHSFRFSNEYPSLEEYDIPNPACIPVIFHLEPIRPLVNPRPLPPPVTPPAPLHRQHSATPPPHPLAPLAPRMFPPEEIERLRILNQEEYDVPNPACVPVIFHLGESEQWER